MTRAIDAVVTWALVCGLLWFAAICVIGAVVHADGVYAAFAVLFSGMAGFVAVRAFTE